MTTSIKTSDGAVKAAAGVVDWIAVSAAATGGTVELNDSTDDSGTDLFACEAPPNTAMFYGPLTTRNEKGIVFGTGIFADITGSNITVTVGYL